jgi:hypothetical protein
MLISGRPVIACNYKTVEDLPFILSLRRRGKRGGYKFHFWKFQCYTNSSARFISPEAPKRQSTEIGDLKVALQH